MQYLSKGNEKNNKKYVRDVFLSEDVVVYILNLLMEKDIKDNIHQKN